MSHSLSKLPYPCVLSTKDRRQFLKHDLRERLYGDRRGMLREMDGPPIAIDGTNDPVHRLRALPRSLAIADAMRLIKTMPTHAAFAWQTGYAAFTVSESHTESARLSRLVGCLPWSMR